MDSSAHTPLTVVSHLYPQATRPNYGVFVYEQTRALVDLGVPVSAVAVPVPWAPWPLPRLSDAWRRYADAERRRVDFGSVEVSFPRYASFPRKLLRTFSAKHAAASVLRDSELRSRIAESGVIIAHTALLDGRVALTLSRQLNLPFVVFVHGEDLYQNVLGPQARRLAPQVREVLAEAAAVIAVSEPVAGGLARAFPDLPRARVLPNGVDTDRFAPRPAPQGDAAPGSPGTAAPLRLLSAGHLVKRKAHAYVLDAVADLSAAGVEVEYTIAGAGEEAQRLAEQARRLGIESRVTFLGAYEHESLPALLHDTDLLVLPSWDEAFGVVYLEALACGVAAIAADDGGARTIIDDAVDGYLVPPKDADAVAKAVKQFAALDADGRARMRVAAREKSLAYTWRANAQNLMDIIDDVIA